MFIDNSIMNFKVLIKKIACAVLILLSLTTIYFRYYLFAPLINRTSIFWLKNHTDLEYMDNLHKSLETTGWEHDFFEEFGRFGTYKSVKWIIAHIKPGSDISHCGQGHKNDALCCITNQDHGKYADGWIEWWKKNKYKTQDQWIKEGFMPHGIKLQKKISVEDIENLLKLLETEKTPRYIVLNILKLLKKTQDGYLYVDNVTLLKRVKKALNTSYLLNSPRKEALFYLAETRKPKLYMRLFFIDVLPILLFIYTLYFLYKTDFRPNNL